VNYQETPAQAAAFTRQLSLTAPILLDRDGAVAERYHVQGLPATFFIDRTGAVVGRVLGYRDWRLPSARAYVLELLAADG
jgi:peroxiredoxin